MKCARCRSAPLASRDYGEVDRWPVDGGGLLYSMHALDANEQWRCHTFDSTVRLLGWHSAADAPRRTQNHPGRLFDLSLRRCAARFTLELGFRGRPRLTDWQSLAKL